MHYIDDEITIFMEKSHAYLDLLIGRVAEDTNIASQFKLFLEFKNKLELHMLIEEKSIFGLTDLAEGSIVEATRRLYKDHIKIKSLVAEIEATLNNKGGVKLTDFIQVMFGHHRLENEVLYPYLDHHLPQLQKESILVEIKANL